ncbi:NADPH-dependent FMN reductase [Radiobacillus kanasensis]|uniref:NADPH-dependent FMN reductase n=1 Tax=Radiobacillus kanasensis TaxID=2844358 RepID=UPI001E33FF6B|nr:NADPH-dependent FMN reductase [Radiobacillus kanasensis]UFU00780.1 NADPH-dependent FMN reductase [Radiobacillus kanasensis]
MSDIVVLSGSPSERSRSDLVLRHLGTLLEKEKLKVTHISIRDVPQEVLFYGKYDSQAIQEITSLIQNAKGVIIGSPVYKAAYSGVLKALIDLLPQDVLQDTPVLPIMTGGSPAHLLAIEYTLKPLLANLKGQNLKGVYLLDSQINKESLENPIIDFEILERTRKQLYYFIQTVQKQQTAVLR